LKVSGIDLHVEDSGGPGPAILFSHGLLWSTSMWRFQVAALRGRYRCIAYDHRGQGKSEVTRSGYDMDTLAADAGALIEQLGAAPVHFVGLSMGGFVGMRVAARRPELVRSLVLVETASDAEPRRSALKYGAMSFLTRFLGTGPFVPAVMKIMFARPFREDPARAALREGLIGEIRGADLTGLRRAVSGVVRREPVPAAELARIRAPTLVLSGDQDSAVVPARSRRTADQIPGARFVSIPRAGHTSSIEEPEAINRALLDFWTSLPN
jgi:pimeloyl-ACP methyl ester carboxylesterase